MKRVLQITILAAMTLGMLAACGKKGSSGKTVATTGLTANCRDCKGIDAAHITDLQVLDTAIQGVVRFHGQEAMVYNSYQESMAMRGDPKYSIFYYMGPLIVEGQLAVSAPLQGAGNRCVLVPGTYQIRTVGVGQKTAKGAGVPLEIPDVILDGPTDYRARIIQMDPMPSTGRVSFQLMLIEGASPYGPGVTSCM